MRIQVLKVLCACLGLSLGVSSARAQDAPIAGPLPVIAMAVQDQPPPPPPATAGQPAPRQPNPAPAPAVRATTAPTLIRVAGQPINVRIELTITDQTGTAAAVKKTVLMTVADEERGAIRSSANVLRPGFGATNVPLSIDATPSVLPDNRVRLRLSLEYNVAEKRQIEAGSGPRDEVNSVNSEVKESMGVILTSGTPLVVAQSADPHTDRRVMLEVKATILK